MLQNEVKVFFETAPKIIRFYYGDIQMAKIQLSLIMWA